MGCTAICLVSGLAVGLVRRRRNMCALVFFISLLYTGQGAGDDCKRKRTWEAKTFR